MCQARGMAYSAAPRGSRLRNLDNRVLGRSGSTRGRFSNVLIIQAHPWLWPVHALMTVIFVVLSIVFVVRADVAAAVLFAFAAACAAFYAYVSRRIPR